MRFLVFAGMKRARGASFRTKETVVEEKPLALATSRIVAESFFFRCRLAMRVASYIPYIPYTRAASYLVQSYFSPVFLPPNRCERADQQTRSAAPGAARPPRKTGENWPRQS